MPSSVYFSPMLPGVRTMGAVASVSFGEAEASEPATGVPRVAGGGSGGGDVLVGAAGAGVSGCAPHV